MNWSVERCATQPLTQGDTCLEKVSLSLLQHVKNCWDEYYYWAQQSSKSEGGHHILSLLSFCFWLDKFSVSIEDGYFWLSAATDNKTELKETFLMDKPCKSTFNDSLHLPFLLTWSYPIWANVLVYFSRD